MTEVFRSFNAKIFSIRKKINECILRKKLDYTAQRKVLCNCFGALLTGKGGYGKGKILSV